MISEGCLRTKNLNKYMLRLGIFALISEIPFDLAFMQYPTYQSLRINLISWTNVFYTLFFGVVCVNVYEKLKAKKNPLIAYSALIFVPVCAFTLLTGNLIVGAILFALYTASVILLAIYLPVGDSEKPVAILRKIGALIPTLPIICGVFQLDTDYGVFAVILIFALYLAKEKNIRLIVLSVWLICEYGFLSLGGVFSASGFSVQNLMSLIFALLSAAIISAYNGKQGKPVKWAFYWFYPVHIAALAFISIVIVK
jgi:hypothetical protein